MVNTKSLGHKFTMAMAIKEGYVKEVVHLELTKKGKALIKEINAIKDTP